VNVKINGAGAVKITPIETNGSCNRARVLQNRVSSTRSHCVMGTTATLRPSNPSSDDDPAGNDARAPMHTDRSLVEEPCWRGLEPRTTGALYVTRRQAVM
jgi:hypothetical protein